MKRTYLFITLGILGALIFGVSAGVALDSPPAPTNPLSQSETLIWVVDLSTFQTLGSDWISPPSPIPPNFRYEPWESLLTMLDRVWSESDKCHVLVGFVSGPEAQSVFRGPPCLDPHEAGEALRRHGPAGWYEFSAHLLLGVRYAQILPNPAIFIINRGPLDPLDDKIAGLVTEAARLNGTTINVVPMGNEPSNILRFPNLAGLERLADATGGRVYYYTPPVDLHDYSALPGGVADQILQDLESR